MKFKRQKKASLELNLTPMIDVVLLLLIFFMVSTTFTKETRLTLELPEATGEPMGANENTLEIIISPSGHFGINGQMLVNDDAQTLKQALTKTIADQTQLPPLVIVADGKSPHQSVVTAMDVAGKLGFVHIRIASITPQQ